MYQEAFNRGVAKSMSILVLGTVALDSVTTPQGTRRGMLGGSAVHFSMSARLFTPVHLVAVVGRDFPGEHISFLRRKGVKLDSLCVAEGLTFAWDGKYEGDMNAAITLDTRLGVLATFSPVLAPPQKKLDCVFLANVDPDIQHALLDSLGRARLVGLDSMNYWIHSKRASLLKLLKKVTLYVANDQEARDLSGERNLIKAARALCAMGPSMVLVKKGEHGAFLLSKDFMAQVPAYPVDSVVDPTGAGDTFAGACMGYLAKAKKIDQACVKKAIAYGTVAASFNVEGFGVEKTARLCKADLDKRFVALRATVAF